MRLNKAPSCDWRAQNRTFTPLWLRGRICSYPEQGMNACPERPAQLADRGWSAVVPVDYGQRRGWETPARFRRGRKMQVLCKSTNGNAEIHCCVCGQGFVMFWERQSRAERLEAILDIQKTLRAQHNCQAGPQAHPACGFMVPERSSPAAFSGASIQGHAPSWAI